MSAPAPWYTVAEVAEALRTSQSRVLGHIHAGRLGAVDISERPGKGRPRWRIPADELERFRTQRTCTRATASAAPAHRRTRAKVRQFI